jgi:hypothetical protein
MTASEIAPEDASTFAGEWVLTRHLQDRRADRTGTADGRLTLAWSGPALSWYEQGTVLWGGRRFAFSRTYALAQGPDGWWVDFADGRPFHPWRPGLWVEHPCGPDLYRGLVTVEDADHWSTVWEVTGPQTDERISTRLTRR